LVEVIEQAKKQELLIGLDYGIISYNDTPLKKVVENGITTISTDFTAMGLLLADMILNNKKDKNRKSKRLTNQKVALMFLYLFCCY